MRVHHDTGPLQWVVFAPVVVVRLGAGSSVACSLIARDGWSCGGRHAGTRGYVRYSVVRCQMSGVEMPKETNGLRQ